MPPGVATPAASTRSRPVSGTTAGMVSVVVPTARSGAIRASATVAPSRRSIRRTSAAAPRSDSADPLRPRVGSRSAPSSRSPSSSTTSVVAFPISTPATTLTGAALHDRGAFCAAGGAKCTTMWPGAAFMR